MKALLAISALAISMAGFAVMQQRNQVLIYVSDPEGAWAGTSDCPPCNRICADLKKHYKTDEGRYIVGTQPKAFFRVVKAPAGVSTPTIVYPGRRPIKGYTGTHDAFVRWHPLSERIKKR